MIGIKDKSEYSVVSLEPESHESEGVYAGKVQT